MKFLFGSGLLGAMFCASTVCMSFGQSLRTGQQAPEFTLNDSDGQIHSLSQYKGKYVVLEWVNYGCPFVKKHYGSGNMQELQRAYTAKGVVWFAICSSAAGNQGFFEGPELKTQVSENKGNQTAYLIDNEGETGKKYGARTTPHMFVINPEGILIYSGAIDDTPSTNPGDIAHSKNYVALALDQALAGKEVGIKSTQSYGCSVKY